MQEHEQEFQRENGYPVRQFKRQTEEMVRRHMVGNQPQERYLFLSAGEGSGRDPENGLVHASTDQELLRHGERGGVERGSGG